MVECNFTEGMQVVYILKLVYVTQLWTVVIQPLFTL